MKLHMHTHPGPVSRLRRLLPLYVTIAVVATTFSTAAPPAMASAENGEGEARIAPAEAGPEPAGSSLGASATAAAADDGDLLITGSGWGHGVGMSQYGAYGMARNGSGYKAILGHYYRGSSVGTMSSPPPLWVNLEMDRTKMTLRVVESGSAAGGPVKITRIVNGEKGKQWSVPVDTRIHVYGPTNCYLKIDRPGTKPTTTTGKGSCDFNLAWDGSTASPKTAVAVEGCTQAKWTSTGVSHLECRYARGTVHVRDYTRDDKAWLALSALMEMDDYTRGISEVPYSWPVEALKAQAVAARSYARELQISRGNPGTSGNNCGAWCHVRDTTWDQRYVGWGQEDTRWNQAVVATADQVVTHPQAPNGDIVRTYYSSSSGGRTEDIDQVWGSTARPYYQGVPDPWAKDPTVNPNASWTVTLDNAAVAKKLGMDKVIYAEVTSRHSSGSAAAVTFTGLSNGATRKVTESSAWMRTTFGLKSIYFDVKLIGPFVDIFGSVHAANIIAIAARGITKGCNPPTNDRFCPGAKLTRGQMAAFLVRALGLPAADKDYFTDDTGSIFENNINRLAASRITLGCTSTRFCPDDTVTRGQMAAFLDRAFGYTAGTGGDRFVDDNGSVFEDNIERIAAAGVTKGCNPPANTRFCPNDPVTRQQMASFLQRALTAAGL